MDSFVHTGGSILGDKTHMARLSNDAQAFIRWARQAANLDKLV
jgi:putative protein kinase ArgK-like GTPase of G3E family